MSKEEQEKAKREEQANERKEAMRLMLEEKRTKK